MDWFLYNVGLRHERVSKDRVAAKLKTIRTVTEKHVMMEGRVVVAELSLLFTDFVKKFWGGSPARSPPVFLMLWTILFKISFRQQILPISFLIIYLLYNLSPLKMKKKNFRKVLRPAPHLKK